MRTTDALKIGIALGRIGATLDAWEESKHPRQPDGKFGSGGGASENAEYAEIKSQGKKKMFGRIVSEISTQKSAQGILSALKKHHIAGEKAQQIVSIEMEARKATNKAEADKYNDKLSKAIKKALD